MSTQHSGHNTEHTRAPSCFLSPALTTPSSPSTPSRSFTGEVHTHASGDPAVVLSRPPSLPPGSQLRTQLGARIPRGRVRANKKLLSRSVKKDAVSYLLEPAVRSKRGEDSPRELRLHSAIETAHKQHFAGGSDCGMGDRWRAFPSSAMPSSVHSLFKTGTSMAPR